MNTKPLLQALKALVVLGLVLSSAALHAQKTVKGKVFIPCESGDGSLDPLPGASVYWKNTQQGTTTDPLGFFKMKGNQGDTLVVSFVGYTTGMLVWNGEPWIEIQLTPGELLNAAEVVERSTGQRMEMLNPLVSQTLDRKELTKAACCNLSESFETNASVDAAYTDAVTGTRQIRMLGLDGKYVETLKDNIPTIRGLSTVYGLYYVPGPWVDQIFISKGVGSVTSGFESITGQINIAMKSPVSSEDYHVNAYVNQGGRTELNLHTRQNVSRRWATTVMLHGEYNDFEMDNNRDGFMDNPLKADVVFRNEWKFSGDRGMEGEYSVTAVTTDQTSGQLSSLNDGNPGMNLWLAEQQSQHVEVTAKTGYVFPKAEWKSIGTQFSGEYHNQESSFGDRIYNGTQRTFRANLLYAGMLGNTNHKFTTGASFLYDDYSESLDSARFERTEQVPGVFFEYTWSMLERFTLVAGMRSDYHNLYGLYLTPRLHARYSFTENTSLKAVGGRGYRTANVIMENIGQLASNRAWVIDGDAAVAGFGLQPEVAWNYGVNLLHRFKLNYREATLSLDFYRTDFENQVITDLENPREVVFYNLEGRSYSNSAQAEFGWSPARRFDIRLAYRWLEVKTDYRVGRLDVPLVSTHRAFSNFAYETKANERGAKSVFDLTVQWIGDQRLPSTFANPDGFRAPVRSNDYFLVGAQITRAFSKSFDFYVGGENLLNFRQPMAILSAENPSSEFFDASLVWGPVFGAMAYAGIRWTPGAEQ